MLATQESRFASCKSLLRNAICSSITPNVLIKKILIWAACFKEKHQSKGQGHRFWPRSLRLGGSLYIFLFCNLAV